MNTNHQAIRYLERVGRWLMAGMLAFLLFAGQIATHSRTTSASVSNTSVPALAMNGKIAFTSNRDGNREIYVMNADGTN
jgi:Tol biopolymer transport system component